MNIHERAIAIDRIIGEPVFGEMVEAIRSEALEKLLSIPATDTDGIREAQALVRAVDGLTDKLRATAQAAKFTKQQIKP